jgi:hypothetical protein
VGALGGEVFAASMPEPAGGEKYDKTDHCARLEYGTCL